MRQRRLSMPDNKGYDSDLSDSDQYHDDAASSSGALLSSKRNKSASHGERSKDFKHRQWIVPLACVLIGVFLSQSFLMVRAFYHPQHAPNPSTTPSGLSGPRNTFTFLNGTRFIKPVELKIVGSVFFGRRQFVKILDCYLRRNLKTNGGMLDEVQFILHTDRKEDIDWLKGIIKRDKIKGYKLLTEKRGDDGFRKWTTFPLLYQQFLSDPNTIYIKMDDDIVFIDDYAIPELVRTTLEHPGAYNIQANIINNEWNQWYHLRTRSLWPYLPEHNLSDSGNSKSWRASELPQYTEEIPPETFEFDKNYKPPRKGHRWLPLKPTFENLGRTPFGHVLRAPNARRRSKEETNGWTVGAQEHYSFFENYERRQLMRYDFGSGHDYTWNLWYQRYSVNMFAMRGSNVLREPNIWDERFHIKSDELLITRILPKILDMPVMVATRAIAAHYAFHGERNALLQTDILDRYTALANERYCMKPIQDTHRNNDDDIGDGPQDDFNPAEADDADNAKADDQKHHLR